MALLARDRTIFYLFMTGVSPLVCTLFLLIAHHIWGHFGSFFMSMAYFLHNAGFHIEKGVHNAGFRAEPALWTPFLNRRFQDAGFRAEPALWKVGHTFAIFCRHTPHSSSFAGCSLSQWPSYGPQRGSCGGCWRVGTASP